MNAESKMAGRSENGAGGSEPQRQSARAPRTGPLLAPIFALIVLFVLASPFVLLRISPTRGAIIDLILAQSGMRGKIRLAVADVERLDPRRITLSGVSVAARTASGEWRGIGEIGRLEAQWSLREALAGHARVRTLHVDSISVMESGIRALAAETSKPVAARRSFWPLKRGLPPAAIDRLEVSSISWINERGEILAGGLAISSLESSEQGFFARIDSLGVRLPRSGVIELRDAVASMVPGARLRVSGGVLSAEGLRAELRGEIDPADPVRLVDVYVQCDRLEPSALARWLALPVTCAANDSLAGSLHATWGARGLAADCDLHGAVLGEKLHALRAAVVQNGDTILIRQVDLRAEAGMISGKGRYVVSPRRVVLRADCAQIDPRSAWLPWLAPIVRDRFGCSLMAEIAIPRGEPVRIEGACSLQDAHPWELPADEITFAGHIFPGLEVAADELAAAFPNGGRLNATGRWPLPRVEAGKSAEFGPDTADAHVAIDELSLALLPESWRLACAGIGSGDFHVHGNPVDPMIEGELAARDLTRGNWRADSLAAFPSAFQPVTLRGGINADLFGMRQGGGSGGANISVSAARGGDVFDVAATLVAQDGQAEVRGQVDPRGQIHLEKLALDAGPFGSWSLDRSCRAGWSANEIWADTLVLSSATGRLSVGGRFLPADGAIDAALTLEGVPAAAIGKLIGVHDTLSGSIDLRLSARDRLPDPRIFAHLTCDSLVCGALSLGKGELRASWQDSTLRVGPVSLRGSGHGLSIDSLQVVSDRPLFEHLSAMQGAPGSSLFNAPLRGSVVIDSISIPTYAKLFGPQLLEPANGTTDGAGHRLIAGQMVPIRIVTPWDSSGQATGSEALAGTLRGRLDISGSAASPELHLAAIVPGLHIAGVPLGELEFAVDFADSLATLDDLQLSGERGAVRAHGYYPLKLGVLPFTVELLPDSAGGQIAIDGLDLALLSGVTRLLPEASGSLSGELVLEGSGTAPRLRGALDLSRGGFRIPWRSERIYDADAKLDVRDNRLYIRSLEARSGRSGVVTATGTFAGINDFDINAHAANTRVFDEGLYDFLATADVRAYTAADGPQGEIVPHLRGSVTVHSGIITQNLTEEPEIRPAPAKVPWVIDLDVGTTGQVRVRQVNANVELGEGTLVIGYRWPWWTLTGTVEIVTGTYRLLNNTFTITEGSLEFRDTGAGPDVNTNIAAETTVSVPGENGGPAETVTIQVNVHGRPRELAVDLSSVPALGEEEIIELLSYGRFTRSGRFEPVAETQWIVFNTLVDRIETSLLEQSPIFSRVTFGTGSSTDDPLRLTLRPIVRPGFMVNYSQDLTQNPAGELLFDYRLSRMLYLHGGMLRHRDGSAGLIDEYSLDLKFRFEYE